MRELKIFDISLRTVYAQAKELAQAQAQVPFITPGSVQIEPRGERRFVYRYRYDGTGRGAEYLGPEDDEATVAKVMEATAEIREAGTLAGYSRDLRRVGFYSADNSTVVTMASLFNAGIFAGGGVLVGTHAFGVLLNELGVRASPFAMTEHIDLARAQRIQIAALPKAGLLTLLRDLRTRSVTVHLAHVDDIHDLLQRDGVFELVAPADVHHGVRDAVAAAKAPAAAG